MIQKTNSDKKHSRTRTLEYVAKEHWGKNTNFHIVVIAPLIFIISLLLLAIPLNLGWLDEIAAWLNTISGEQLIASNHVFGLITLLLWYLVVCVWIQKSVIQKFDKNELYEFHFYNDMVEKTVCNDAPPAFYNVLKLIVNLSTPLVIVITILANIFSVENLEIFALTTILSLISFLIVCVLAYYVIPSIILGVLYYLPKGIFFLFFLIFVGLPFAIGLARTDFAEDSKTAKIEYWDKQFAKMEKRLSKLDKSFDRTIDVYLSPFGRIIRKIPILSSFYIVCCSLILRVNATDLLKLYKKADKAEIKAIPAYVDTLRIHYEQDKLKAFLYYGFFSFEYLPFKLLEYIAAPISTIFMVFHKAIALIASLLSTINILFVVNNEIHLIDLSSNLLIPAILFLLGCMIGNVSAAMLFAPAPYFRPFENKDDDTRVINARTVQGFVPVRYFPEPKFFRVPDNCPRWIKKLLLWPAYFLKYRTVTLISPKGEEDNIVLECIEKADAFMEYFNKNHKKPQETAFYTAKASKSVEKENAYEQ